MERSTSFPYCSATHGRSHMSETVLITGGAGYIGAHACGELLRLRAAGARARRAAARPGERRGGARARRRRGRRGRHPRRRGARAAALEGADAVVHLAAIVGDPACARDPELPDEVNVEATLGAGRRRRRGRRRRASCSPRPAPTTAAWPTRRCRSARTARCAPVSLYAEQKVAIERALLDGERDAAAAHLPALRHASTAPRRGCASI